MTFSQTVTSDSLVCIKPTIARQIAQDLVRYDECKEISEIQDSTIYDLQSIVSIQNESIDILTEMNKTYASRTSMLEKTITLKDIEIANTKNDLRKSNNWKRFYGLGFTVTFTTTGALVLIHYVL